MTALVVELLTKIRRKRKQQSSPFASVFLAGFLVTYNLEITTNSAMNNLNERHACV